MQEISKRRKSVQDSLKELEKEAAAAGKVEEGERCKPQGETGAIGLPVSVTQFYLLSAVLGVVVLAMTFLAGMPPLVMVGGAFVAGLGLPRWVVGFLVKRRQKKFSRGVSELPRRHGAFDPVWLPLNDAIRMIAADGQEPVKTEFRRIVESQQLGLSVSDAVARMHQTMPLNEVSFFAIVIAIQGQAGGNLSKPWPTCRVSCVTARR